MDRFEYYVEGTTGKGKKSELLAALGLSSGKSFEDMVKDLRRMMDGNPKHVHIELHVNNIPLNATKEEAAKRFK